MNRLDSEILRIAKAQHGVVSREQLEGLGASRAQIRWRIRCEQWQQELRGVWRMGWAEPSWMQRLWCASLWGGAKALISHRAAARLWELEGIETDLIDLTAPRGPRASMPWLHVHRNGPVVNWMRRVREGVAVTSPSRTLLDLSAVVDEDTLERVIEHTFRRRIASISELRRALRAMPARGRRGIANVEKLLDRGTPTPQTQSELERRALRLFRRAGLPVPQCQYQVIEGERLLGTVDFAWPNPRVIVEAEGFQFHSGRRKWESDLERYNLLALHGWLVLRLTWTDLQGGAEDFARRLVAALKSRATFVAKWLSG